MKRKLKGLLLGVAMMAAGSMAVMAAPSISKNGTVSQDFTINGEAGDTDKYKATFEVELETTVKSEEVLNLIEKINAQPELVEQVLKDANVSPEDEGIMERLQLLTEIQDLSIVDPATGVPIEGLTNVTLTWEVPNLTSSMENIRVLHYSTVRSVWEILTPEQVDYENKAITQTFEDLSPVAVLYTLDDGADTSPGTGDGARGIYYVAAGILALIVCMGVLVSRKKVKTRKNR